MAKKITKTFNSQLRTGMKQVVGSNECYQVAKKYIEGCSDKGNCHANVAKAVDLHGGTQQFGWLLRYNKQLNAKGVYAWTFHSVWCTDDGKYFDITADDAYKGQTGTVVWFDSERRYDFENGINYNNIAVFTHNDVVEGFSQAWGFAVTKAVPYWALSTMRVGKAFDAYDGTYRIINTQRYPNNTQLLRERYGLNLVDGKLVNESGNNEVSVESLFEFGLGARV